MRPRHSSAEPPSVWRYLPPDAARKMIVSRGRGARLIWFFTPG